MEQMRQEQGDEAAEKWAAQQYAEANGIQLGGAAGAIAGAAIGSVVPVIGTTIGAIAGGILGAWKGLDIAKK